MDLGDVMDAVAARLDTIAGLRVFAYPPSTLVPPAAVVGYPESIDFDTTYGRGTDRITLPVVVLVGRVSDRTSRDRIAAYADGSGGKSVKAVLESGTYAAFDSLRVTEAVFDVVTVGGTDHLAVEFTVDIVGKGA